jgi:hypothetical protein
MSLRFALFGVDRGHIEPLAYRFRGEFAMMVCEECAAKSVGPDENWSASNFSVMPTINKKLGQGGIVSARASVLHPEEIFRAKHINDYHEARILNLKVVGKCMKTVKNEQKAAILMHHDDFPGQEIWAFAGAVKLDKPGPSPYFSFAEDTPAPPGRSKTFCFVMRPPC